MQNHVILVDESDREIGTEEKMSAHESGRLHRAFSVFIFNGRGQMLLQRRAYGKYHSPGLFSNACCSHPSPGEETESAAHRRLNEELGFDCELRYAFPLRYSANFDNGLTENEYDHVFVGVYDGDVAPNPEEVAEVRWISFDDLRYWLVLNPDAFTVWFRLSVERAIEAREAVAV